MKWGDLEADRQRLTRVDTVERVAEVIRARIISGDIPPGDRLSEESIGKALDVSRNTLREAFRLLGRERLVVHHFNRGVFVRELTLDDLRDIYETRRVVESWAILHGESMREEAINGMQAAVDEGQAAAQRGDWRATGTADLEFHHSLAKMPGSPRLEALMRLTLAEFCLAFGGLTESVELHEPYLSRNQELLRLLQVGETEGAHRELMQYLDDSESQLVQAYAQVRGISMT